LNDQAKSQAPSKHEWFVTEVAGLCHSKSSQGLFGVSSRRAGGVSRIIHPWAIAPNHGMRTDPCTGKLARNWGSNKEKTSRMRSGIRNDAPATFDCRLLLPPNLTCKVPIGRGPANNHQIRVSYFAPAYIRQVAGYLVWPDRQSLIVFTAFPPHVDAPRCTLFYVLRHVSICVDLQLRPAMYVYAVMSVYLRLRLATRCRLRMSTCVNTVDARRHTSSIS
jgi:hypothetical protein